MSTPAAMRTLLTSRPSAPVCGETILLENMNFAASCASSGELTSLTNPALPRPPAKTWALTTARVESWFAAIDLYACVAWSAEVMSSPSGTGML